VNPALPARTPTGPGPGRREPLVLLVAGLVLLAWSVVRPHDYFTWFMEVAPIFIGVPILVATYRRFPLTPLLYRLIFLHAVILMVGGHYTYAEVPLGFWMERGLGFTRNNYDRIGHFAQGFVPAILAREILLRRGVVTRRGWLFFLVTCVCLGFSAFYELVEWWTAELTGSAADAFLGTQGDHWDTQWDMFYALVGALASQLVLGRVHDRQLI
jgi:putative membrane protein